MRNKIIQRTCVFAGLLVTAAVAGQDQFTVVAPSGIAFAEFSDYQTWQYVAPSLTDKQIKIVAANPAMIAAFKDGFPANGKPVPDGAAFAKIEWAKKPSSEFPAQATMPGNLEAVEFMVKDSKRFPETNGWGYADFRYDAASGTFTPSGNPTTALTVCHTCHTAVKAKDFVFTAFPKR